MEGWRGRGVEGWRRKGRVMEGALEGGGKVIF